MIPGSFKSVLSVKMWLTDLSMETRNTFLFPKSDIKNSCTSFHLWCDGYVPITNIFSPYCWVDYNWIPFCRKKAHTNYNNCNSISSVILYNYSFGKTFFFFNFHYVAIKWCFSGVFFHFFVWRRTCTTTKMPPSLSRVWHTLPQSTKQEGSHNMNTVIGQTRTLWWKVSSTSDYNQQQEVAAVVLHTDL